MMRSVRMGKKNLSKGVRIEVTDGVVRVDLSLYLKYGYSVPETSAQVQEKVRAAIENMTGLKVSDVNISIVGVDVEKANE